MHGHSHDASGATDSARGGEANPCENLKMPAVINWVIGAAAIVIGAITGIVPLIMLGGSLILGSISKMFAKGSSASSLSHEIANRTITSRQAVAFRKTDSH
jgi:predicted phage tail protein